MRAVSVVAFVAATCGYFVSVMSRFFIWFLPEEQKRTDKQVYRRTLYGVRCRRGLRRRAMLSARPVLACFSCWP